MLKRFFTIAVVIFCTTCLMGQTQFDIQAPSVVSQGERFTIKFKANARIDNFSSPDISGAAVLAGPVPSESSYTQIINGKRTDSYEHTYTYVLQAGDQSVIAISQATANIDGKSYNSRPVTIEVVSSGAASSASPASSTSSQTASPLPSSANSSSNPNSAFDNYDDSYDSDNITYGKADIFLRLYLNKTKVVKGEPIIATLKIYTRSGIAGFEDVKFPVFNGFWSQELETPQNINFSRERVDNQIYNSALLRKYVIIPQQTGTLTIEPAEIVCQVQVMERAPRGRSIFDDFFGTDTYSIQKKKLSTGKKSVVVNSLPSGAPADFGGGVGHFNMNVRLSKDSLKSNDAASVIVEISGNGNLNLIETPNITFPADFEKYDVRTTNNYSNSAEGTQGKRVFEYPFIPRVDGDYTIPPITYSYFDLSSRRYTTLTSDSLRIKVSKGDGVTSNNYTDFASQRKVSNLGEDIRYIKRDNPSLKKIGLFHLSSFNYYLIILLLLSLFTFIYTMLKRSRKISSDVVRVRNRRANKTAKLKLRQSQIYLKENKLQEFYTELHTALSGYIADKLSIPYADMQKSTIENQLIQRGIESEKVSDFINLLDECEMVRYSPNYSSSNMSVHYQKAQDFISFFEGKL